MAHLRRSETQGRGLFLILLLLGHEAQAIGAATDAEPAGGRRKANATDKVNFAVPDASVERLVEHAGGGQARSLLSTVENWQWPAQTKLKLTSTNLAGDVITETSATQVTLLAGKVYEHIAIEAKGTTFGSLHDQAKIKPVKHLAGRDQCKITTYDVPVGLITRHNGAPVGQQALIKAGAGEMGFTKGPMKLTNAGSILSKTTSPASIVFMFGGLFKLCYTPDGSFGGGDGTEYKNNVLNVNIKILGVTSPCATPQTDGCIEEERWECSFGKKGEFPYDCVFNLRSDGGRKPNWGVTPGGKSRMSWTQSFLPDGPAGPQARICADSPPEKVKFDTTKTGLFLKLDGIADPTSMPPVKADYKGSSFTLAACYCPNYDAAAGTYCGTATSPCCDQQQEYIQQFGIIYYWHMKICDKINYASCTSPYMRVIPQQKFVVRVDCPPSGGCLATNVNRIKFIEHKAVNERPTWDSEHGCKTMVGESARAVWPTISDSKSLSGGALTTYKAWNVKQVKFNLSLKRRMDVCYCNKQCENPKNWFRIGSIMSTDSFAIAKRTASGSSTHSIKYINTGGSVTLYGGITSSASRSPFDSNMYSGKALVNIISYDRDKLYGIGDLKKTLEEYNSYDSIMPTNFQTQMDSECQRENYQPTLVKNAWSKLDAKAYIAKVDAVDDTISRYLTFSGELKNNKLTIVRAGMVGICYCALLSAQDACLDPAYWVFAGRLTIHGPTGGQTWLFPTNIIVKIELLGWGFTGKDKLRIIDGSSSCSNNNNQPVSYDGFKVGCPSTQPPQIGQLGCRFAGTAESIDLNVLTAQSSQTFISAVAVSPMQTTVSFSKSIAGILSTGDIITLDKARISNGGKLLAAQTEQQKFETHELAGMKPFQDELTQSYMNPHKLKQVKDANGMVKTQQLTIPKGWPTQGGPAFTFTNSQGYWTRHNKIETPLTIKGVSNRKGLKVCWGVHDSSTKFYAQAGVIEFETPTAMKSAKINLSTKRRDTIAPIVISFTTWPQLSAYAAAQGAATTLMLRFLDISDVNGKLIPQYAGDSPPDSSGVEVISDTDQILETEKRQWVCGRLFNELWSKDSEGFPMPTGCYFGKKLKDNVEKGIKQNFYRELYLSFPAGSGLKQNTDYQMVINAKVKDVVAGENLLDLYSLCTGTTGCARPYQVFEKGTTTASSGTEVGATYADPSFNTQGIVIQRGEVTTGVLDLSTMNILQVRLRGKEDNAAIQKNCNLRLYLWPLTLWVLGTGCLAECRAYHLKNTKCDGALTCKTEAVVAGSGRNNVIKLKLPADMHSITASTQHTVKVTGLTRPVAGFFPSRIGAQVTRPDDSRPSYTTSSGHLLMKQADQGTTTGRLVLSDRTGYGPKPFAADTGNILYIRLSFGATIWNNGQKDAAQIQITLPDGYSCKVPDGGAPDFTLPVFTSDRSNDGYYDSSRGSLSTASADGNWANSKEKRCVYVLKQHMAIFAGMVVFVKVTVNNPGTPLQKMDQKNVWKIRLSSKGSNIINPSPADMTEQPFITLADERALGVEYWAGNAAVLSSLKYETIQPTDFRRSTATYTDSQYVHVFFGTTQYVGRNGYVVVDAPDGYDFGATCMAQNLPSKYYAYRGTGPDQVFMLKNMATCTGLRSPAAATTYNRARIVVGGIIGRELFYGFRIRVKHPKDYNVVQHTRWYVWTQDSNRYGLEGSKKSVLFNKWQSKSQVQYYHKSYGMYNGNFFDSFHIEIQGMQPKSITSTDSEVTIYPIAFKTFTDTSLRITAPYGYIWTATADAFTAKMNQSTRDFPNAPTYENSNQLVWPKVVFANNQVYGFKAKIKVPNFGPVTSSDNFFVEFGYNKLAIRDRLMAAMLPAPKVRTMTNCGVGYASNLKSYTTNWIEFRFQTVTLLWEGEGIVIKGDANTMGFSFKCPPRMLEDSAKFPSDLKCIAVEAQDSLPQIVLKAQETPVAPGFYKFELPSLNPTRRIIQPGKWKFGSYKVVSQYPDAPQIDNYLWAPGFSINGPILDARLMTLSAKQQAGTKRNDRPNKPNQLIFRFQLAQTPTQESPLLLRGPRGFEFEEDCKKSVITAKNFVFGPNTESTWPPDITVWPNQFSPTACSGEGRFATITIPAGLGRRNMYVFRISVTKNPASTPQFNKWTVDYKQESSEPFEGFIVWTFTHTKVTPVSLAKSPTGANVARTVNPVEIKFRPYNRVPFKCPSCATGGLLRITSPNRFEFVQMNGECTALLFETNGGPGNGFHPSTLRCQVSPTLRTKLFLEIIGGTKVVDSGRDYTLIVEVYNPSVADQAENWALDSFNSKASANINNDQIALDESVMMGSEINNVLNIWTVNNKYKRYNGKTKVNDVEVTMQFPDAMKDGDEIFVYAPLNFDLEGNPELKDCKQFRWPPNTNPFPNSGTPTCRCVAGVCRMRFYIREYKDPAYPQNENIQFAVATQNPAKTPFVTRNFWRVEHKRQGMVKSSHVYPSWSINPQLEDGQINLVGPNQAAGTESDLTFIFKPVSDAGTIKIEALFPTEFDFGKATVPVPYDIDDRSERGIIIINRANIIAGRTTSIKISSVKLGRGGGQTRFNLITYSDDTMKVKRDEKLEYTGGFRLPGKIVVTGKTLKSKYQNERQLFPVKSLFQARVSELAVAEFFLMFSQPVMAAQKLIIACLGDGAYELRSAPFVIIGKERVETSVERTAGKLTELMALLKPGRPATEVALQADTPYTVVFWTIPKQGTNNWKFMTSDSGMYPTNTNDGITTGFRPVEQLGLTVSTPRSPPRAIIKVTLNVDPRSAVVLELLIIAPPAFVFPPTGCGKMCQAGQALGATMRRTATIASPTGEPLTNFQGIEINVQTPEQTPGGAQSWFVEARGQGRGTTTGWGEGAGFRVQQMVSGVGYAGVASLRSAQITFHFTLEVDAGSEIAVEPPTNYILSCSTEGALKQGSLPGGRPGCTDEPLVLMLSTTLTRGGYSFAVAVDLPAQKPTPNNFNIIIRDRDNRVVDAAYSLPGVDLLPAPVSSPTLSWSRAEPGQNSIITVSITFTSDYNLVKALLISFPKKFIHAILRPTDVQNMNRRFPVAASQSGGWAEWFQDKIRIYLDDSDDATVIARDTYSWSFPVLVPVDNVPKINVWYFTLCSERTCEKPKGRGTIVSFPMQGFALREISSATLKVSASSARPQAVGLGTAFASCVLSALLALAMASS